MPSQDGVLLRASSKNSECAGLAQSSPRLTRSRQLVSSESDSFRQNTPEAPQRKAPTTDSGVLISSKIRTRRAGPRPLRVLASWSPFFGAPSKSELIKATFGWRVATTDRISKGVARATILRRGSRPSDSARSWLLIRFRSAIKTRTACPGVEL